MRKLLLLLLCTTFFVSVRANAASGVVIYPQGFINFPNVPAGSTCPVPQTITVYNEGTVSATLSSVTLSIAQFTLVSGTTPVTLAPGNPAGRVKASTTLLNFFKTDHTATPWFLASAAK
jgi:hypothetical protein